MYMCIYVYMYIYIYIYIYILVWTRAYTCTLSSRLGDCGPSITLLGSFSAWLAELCRVKIYYVATAFAEFFLSGMLCGPVGSRCADPLCGPVVRTRCGMLCGPVVRTRCRWAASEIS